LNLDPFNIAQAAREVSMRRFRGRASILGLCASLAICGVARQAAAQGEPAGEPAPPAGEPAPPAGEPAPPPAAEPSPPGAGEPAPPGGTAPAPAEAKPGQLGSISWQDIVIVQRLPILKYHRVELIPTYNVTINNSLIRHHGFGGIINFFLSERLNLGIEGTYYQNQNLDHYFLRGLDDRVLPSVNRYFWSATFNFGYVPAYGKFALFNKWIIQYEVYVQAGVGVIQTDWIPRDPANSSVTNYDVLWHVDLGTRVFITKWLAFHAYLKDYMFVDSFEPATRQGNNGDSRFVQNIVFGVGIGMFLPTSFEYKYTR
jgi:outer membrane beta-barrel protein